MHLASRLGWSLDSSGMAGEVDPESCTDKIHAMFSRARYYKQGKIQEKDSGKAFLPDWAGLAVQDPVQNELSSKMVCIPSCLLVVDQNKASCFHFKTSRT
jgi:hypothetical protein